MSKKKSQRTDLPKSSYQVGEDLRNKLKLKSILEEKKLREKHVKTTKELEKRGVKLSHLRHHSAKLLAAGAIASSLLLNPPNPNTKLLPEPPKEIISKIDRESVRLPALSNATKLRMAFKEVLPKEVRTLSQQEKKYLEKVVQEMTGIPAKTSLEGEKLNRTYGRIGAEQHLRRYPGDTSANHKPDPGEYGSDRPRDILSEGMAPGLGAWGYFAPSKEALTPDLEEVERWYSVAQTLYLPDWNRRQPYLKQWYKYRKLLIVNTENGKAVVTALADSGPAAWSGKHFGGSPEVMDYLGGPKYKKGPVLVFFVDDPDNKIPLGPVQYNDSSFKLEDSSI